MKVQILNENVLIKITVEKPSDEVVTAGGIVIKQDKTDPNNLPVPVHGTVIQVGPGVPEEVKNTILNKRVALPSGNYHRVPDINNPEMTDEEYLQQTDRYIYTHHKNLNVLFVD